MNKWAIGLFIATPFLMIISVISMLNGYGTAVPLVFLFPFSALIMNGSVNGDFITILIVTGAIQNLIYGVSIIRYHKKSSNKTAGMVEGSIFFHILSAGITYAYLETQHFF